MLVLVFLCCLVWPGQALAKREHIVHFADTAYELHVFKIQGRRPGPTLMLIGGIQGNEPGGFWSADLYADMALEKGNLIVVPRANFLSIMLNRRGPNGDMNRKFNLPEGRDLEIKVVRELKKLISQADCLLNLHDGSGFYRPTNVSGLMNPRRFGQSIIADAARFTRASDGLRLNLRDMAEAACKKINASIANPAYHFRFNNHRTMEPGSPNAEQKGSATYYALTKVGIPAFGVESSKDLPSMEMKIRHHNLAINAFMDIMGLEPENPALNLTPPKLRYLIVTINGSRPLMVMDGETLTVSPGDEVFVSHIEANYERGLSCDFLGMGEVNDLRRRMRIDKPATVIVRRDHVRCGAIQIRTGAATVRAAALAETTAQTADHFLVRIGGREVVIGANRTLDLIEGDTLELVDSWTAEGKKGRFALNFKGFVAPGRPNTGDDRQASINTASDLIKRWSVEGRGLLWRVEAEAEGKSWGRFFVRLNRPDLEYVILKTGSWPAFALAPGDKLRLAINDTLTVVDFKTNFLADKSLSCYLVVNGVRRAVDLGRPVKMGRDGAAGRAELTVFRYGTPLGTVFLETQSATADSEAAEPAG